MPTSDAQRAMLSLTQGHTLFWRIKQFVFIVEPESYKLYSE